MNRLLLSAFMLATLASGVMAQGDFDEIPSSADVSGCFEDIESAPAPAPPPLPPSPRPIVPLNPETLKNQGPWSAIIEQQDAIRRLEEEQKKAKMVAVPPGFGQLRPNYFTPDLIRLDNSWGAAMEKGLKGLEAVRKQQLPRCECRRTLGDVLTDIFTLKGLLR